jgi:hypothetical protein
VVFELEKDQIKDGLDKVGEIIARPYVQPVPPTPETEPTSESTPDTEPTPDPTPEPTPPVTSTTPAESTTPEVSSAPEVSTPAPVTTQRPKGGGSVSDIGRGKVDFGLNPTTTTAATSASAPAATIPATAPTSAPGNSGTPSANVAQDGSVDGKKTTEDVGRTINEINRKVKSGQIHANSAVALTVHIPVKNAETLRAETIRLLAALSKNVGKNIVIDADTTDAKGKILVRIYADITKLANVKHDIALKGTADKTATKPITDRFARYYSNTIAVVSLAQKGSFGAKLEIAARVDLTGLDKSKLIAYSYDSETNRIKLIKDAKIKVDKNGFVHFTTESGGEIIITDKPLTKIEK